MHVFQGDCITVIKTSGEFNNANSLLRSCDDDIFGNIYFTPDLTKTQRKKAYELRTERRLREERGERNLKISRGQIIVVKEKGGGTTSGGSPSISEA